MTYGRDIRGYLDGQLLLEAEDGQFAESGAIGLSTKADAATQFDDFQIVAAFRENLEEMPAPAAGK